MTKPPGPYGSESEILKTAQSLKGKTLIEIIPHYVLINTKNKGAVGNLIEQYAFGVPNNSLAEPDFIAEGIELKVLPLTKRKEGLGVKERTKICSINYQELPSEEWPDSHARNKLNRILFIFYKHSYNLEESKVVGYELYELGKDEPILKSDWERVRTYVQEGKAHQLSERIARYLSPSRTGSGGLDGYGNPKDLVNQYKNAQPKALRRAFSLKPSYTSLVYQEHVQKKKLSSLTELNLNVPEQDLPAYMVEKLNQFQGMTLAEFASNHGVAINNGKASGALIVRKALGLEAKHKNIREFQRLGLKFKTIPTHQESLKPFEAMSFPYTSFRDIIEFDAAEVGLLDDLSDIIIIPILRPNRKERNNLNIIGKSFYWTPSEEEIDIIYREYHRYQDFLREVEQALIKKGLKAAHEFWDKNFIRASDTEVIHMRPHARDSKDYDTSIPELKKCKYSFWVNKRKLQSLITENQHMI